MSGLYNITVLQITWILGRALRDSKTGLQDGEQLKKRAEEISSKAIGKSHIHTCFKCPISNYDARDQIFTDTSREWHSGQGSFRQMLTFLSLADRPELQGITIQSFSHLDGIPRAVKGARHNRFVDFLRNVVVQDERLFLAALKKRRSFSDTIPTPSDLHFPKPVILIHSIGILLAYCMSCIIYTHLVPLS